MGWLIDPDSAEVADFEAVMDVALEGGGIARSVLVNGKWRIVYEGPASELDS